ncbi:aminotransferase class V-fold PLP-dependent enzyme [Candidatus Daviesbacteria bacterium]|nr:aminotransferase class V-fold PLP-dependent enzyme [Candidatus Daviesbacteria bacterium]
MKKIFFTVGPSQIYPTVPSHIKKAIKSDVLSMSHRGQEFKDIYKSTVDGLRKLLNIPADFEIVFVSSALEAMERVIQAMSHNNTYHILTGFFGKTWLNIARDLGKSPGFFQFFAWEKNSVVLESLEKIEIPTESELVCITQNDTSVGFSIPMEEIYALRKRNPEKLFALDIVSSVPYVD